MKFIEERGFFGIHLLVFRVFEFLFEYFDVCLLVLLCLRADLSFPCSIHGFFWFHKLLFSSFIWSPDIMGGPLLGRIDSMVISVSVLQWRQVLGFMSSFCSATSCQVIFSFSKLLAQDQLWLCLVHCCWVFTWVFQTV